MTRRGQYPARKDDDYDDEEQMSTLDLVKSFASRDLEHIGLNRAMRFKKAYGRDDLRYKKAILECFFEAYAILGTVRYAAQVCGLNPKKVSKLIKNNDTYKARFDVAHEQFCEYLEQVAVVRALNKSDSLLQFLLKANNPRKFSERLRIQALEAKDDDKPLNLVFGEYSPDWEEPNYKNITPETNIEGDDTIDKEELR